MFLIVLVCVFKYALSADESVRFLLNNANHQGLENRISVSILNASIVNTTLPTIFLAHGYIESADVYYYKNIPAEFLKKGNYNIIGLDWSKLASSLIYPESAKNTKIAGDAMGELIVALHKVGLDLANVHVIGHSLGSHVAGYAGQFVQNALNSSIAKITSLDPAGPSFYKHFKINRGDDFRLSRNDAVDVVVLHTDRGGFGLDENIGTIDFDANYGRAIQPGCHVIDIFNYTLDEFLFCSHQMSVRFFTESINSNGFVATCKVAEGCGNTKMVFGPDVPVGARGVYKFLTNNKAPYAKN